MILLLWPNRNLVVIWCHPYLKKSFMFSKQKRTAVYHFSVQYTFELGTTDFSWKPDEDKQVCTCCSFTNVRLYLRCGKTFLQSYNYNHMRATLGASEKIRITSELIPLLMMSSSHKTKTESQ